ncbi:uncharacterized protein LOC132544587 [Ylistrum balloti]|uniref:uncharacterized protein LOC132544587 n=1 Tax=Ylistrum balloti TaxID=509963 RepID=UPI002905A266|nr:uncharacterized protein LOC132544587 [Ylistrum balloti]
MNTAYSTMADITSCLQNILENQKQIQEATRLNSVNIARMYGEFTQSTASIKALLQVLNHRIENNVFSSPVPQPNYESRHRSHPGLTRTGGDGDVSGMEGVHKECLQEYFEYIVKELTVDGTTLIDELQEDSCLTEGEASDIRYQKDTKARIRKLIYAIYTRDKSAFDIFMKKLKSDNFHVYEKIQQAYSSKLNEGPRASKCLICVVKRDVDIRRVADKLCSHFIIDMDYLNTLLSYSDHSLPKVRKEFWSHVFFQIDNSNKKSDQIQQLCNALSESNYKKHAENLQRWSHPQLACSCSVYSRLSFPANFSDSFSTSASTGDLSTTSNIRSQSRTSLQSVSSLEGDAGNLPYTVAWLNSSPAPNAKDEPWPYPGSQNNLQYSQAIHTEDSVYSLSKSTEEEHTSSLSIKPLANEVKENLVINDRQDKPSGSLSQPTSLANEKSPRSKPYPPDVSTDEVESRLKPSRLELDVDTARKLGQKILEAIVTPLPVVDVYTGRKKMYTKKRHTRTRSDESSKIRLENDQHRIGEQNRLRLINGLLDTPERGISEIFSRTKHTRSRSLNEDQTISAYLMDKVDIDHKQDQCITDNRPSVTTPPGNSALTQTFPDKNDSVTFTQQLSTSDGINNPKLVTDQIILTPSRHLEPLSSGLGTRPNKKSSNPRRRKPMARY